MHSKHTGMVYAKQNLKSALAIMGISQGTLPRRVKYARSLKQVSKEMCKDTDIVNAYVRTEDDVYTHETTDKNDKKPHVNQHDKFVPETWKLSIGNYSSMYAAGNVLYHTRSIQGMVPPESDFVKEFAKHRQYCKSSYRGTKYNLAQRYTGKRYYKINKKHYEDISSGNVSNTARLEFANGDIRNTFVSMAANKARCKAKVGTFLCNKYNDETGASKFQNSAQKCCAGPLNANRNNSRYLDDSGSDADEDGRGVEDSSVGDSKNEDIKWEDSKCDGSKSEELDSGEGMRSKSSVTSEVCYSKFDSENNESKHGSTEEHTECHDVCDDSSHVADDTVCSIDFENISGSVYWSEEASNDNHIDGVDDIDNHDDNKDTTYCENTLNEESNDFFVLNCAPMNTGHNCKHHSPSYVGLLTGQSVTNSDGQNATFLDNAEDILEHSVFNEAMVPILTRGRSSLPLKIMSLTSNHFDNYKRMFEAFKTRIFPNTNEQDSENCDRRKDGGCLRRCVSIADNDSASENSRVLQLSSSDSEICNKDHINDNERSKQNSDKEVEETDRILPAWCDWEAEFDYVNSDYLEARPPKDHTIVRCAEVDNQVTGNSLGKADAGKNRHDQGKQLKAVKSKHFSSCMQKKGSRTSLAHQGKKVNNIRKSTTKVSTKKKLINFKFQGPPKHDGNQYMNNSQGAVFADKYLPNEAADQDVLFHQTSAVTIVARKPMSRLSVENQNVVIARHTKEVEDSPTMDIIHKDTHREHPLGMRKNTLENIDSFQEVENSQVTEIVPKDTDCEPALNIRQETLNNGNRERTKGQNYSEVTKQVQPCDDSVYGAEKSVASLADFKTSPEVKQDDSDNASDSVDQEYSTPEAHHRSGGTEHSLEQTQQEKTKKTDNGTHTRLPSSEFDNNARGTVRNSAEIPTDNVNRGTKSEEKGTESDICDKYLPDQQIPSVTPEKTTVPPKETRRNFRDVFKAADTRPQRDTQNESRMGRLSTSIPTVFKVMSELSLRSVSSPQITIVRPKYTVFGSKARKRRLDTRKGGKSKDHGHQQKKWLGKHYTQAAKPRKSSSQSKSEKSLTNVPRINTKCIFPIPALASSREHKCYLKYHNRDTMRNIGHTYSTGLAMDQTVTGSARPSTVKSDESLTADVDDMNQEHPRFAAADLEANVFIFNKNDYYYYVQPMRSPGWPDSGEDISIYSPARSISNSKDAHSISDIYFADIPRRVVSRTQITESSPISSRSLTDIYFSNIRSKYELVDETTYTQAEYEHCDADMPQDEDGFSREGSLYSSTDVKDHGFGELHNSNNEDMIFYDDCLLELINKRAVTNTANPDTAKICCRESDSSEMNNSVPSLKQTLTISDLLAESICLPADENNLVNTIRPEVSLIQESEHNVRNKHTSKRKRAKRNSDQYIVTPPHREPCLDENENTENMQFEYDKTPSCQDSMADRNVAQSLVLAATEDNNFETKLVNYEYHNFEEFHRRHKDHRNAVKSSNLESNTPWHIDQPPKMPEHSRTAESQQFIDNEPSAYAIQDMNNDELCSQYSFDSEDKAKEGDVYEFDSNLKHKVALLLQRIEDTNCIKIVSTQEFYKKKHGAASFINDLAKMIDENLERCNDAPQEKIVNGHSMAAKELVVACTPRKVPRKEKAYTQREERSAKKAPDSGAQGKQVYENKHRLCSVHADGDEVKDMETMGCLARHVRKQISAMHRYNNNEGMALLKQDNTLCAYTNDHRSTKEINKELKTTGKAMSKGSTRNENKRAHEDSGIVQRLVESAAEKCDKNCNINLACLAAEGGQALGSNSYNKSQSTEGKKALPDRIHYNLHNKRIYSDCSDGSIITESNQSDYNQEDKSQKVNTDDYYDSDSNNLALVSSASSVLTSRDADIIPKCQLQLKEDIQRDGFHARKETPGSKMRQHQPSASRKPPKVRKSHQNSEMSLQQGNPQTEYTCTNVRLAKNSENKAPCEGAKNESNGKNANLFSGLKDSSRLKVANFPLKNTSGDTCYWDEDVGRDTKVDVQCLQTGEPKLDHEYEEYYRHHRCIDASSHSKEKALKTTGTQYDQPEVVAAEESKNMYTLAGGADSSTDIYYDNKDKVSVSGSDQDLSDGSSFYQIQTEDTPLSDQGIPQVPSCTKCHKISPPFARLDYPKRKKNVTFQEDESREANTQSTTNKQTDMNHNDDLISDNRRTVNPQGSQVQNKEYSSRVHRTNATVVNSSQQTNPMKRCTNTTPQESGDRSPKPCLYSWDNSDEGEISRPGFVSYIHKHRRQKSQSAATKEISSTDTVCSQQSKDNKPTCGQTKGTITHEPSCKDNQCSRIGIGRKESQTDKGIIQNPNISQRTDMTNVGFRRDTGQNKSPTGGHRFAKEDCVKHSIASLNSNDRSGGRVQKYADIVNKPLFSLTGSPKASVEYTISGKSKLDESNKKKVVPSPRVDLGSTYLQRGHSGPEVAKKAFEVVSGGIKVAGIEHDVAKSGLKVTRNEHDVAKSGLTFARNEHEMARSGFKVAKNEPSVARNDHSLQDTARHTWQIGNLSMPKNVDSSKRRSISPFSLTPTRDWEVSASRSVSCHDMRVNSQTKQPVMQGSDDQPTKPRSNCMVSYPSPTCLSPKRNYKGVLHNQTLGSEIIVAPTFLSSMTLRGNSKDSESLMSTKSLRGNSKESETLMSSKSLRGNYKNSETLVFSQSFRGNPRDSDDVLGRREYSSEGYFIPENDDEHQDNTRYLIGLDHLTERFSPELTRRNSLPNYDFQERYHNSHSLSPCEHPTITSRQNLFASTGARNTREGEQRGVLRPQRDAALEKAYLENKQQELQKGFQNYWSERMKMRKEEFERIRQEYRPGLRSTEEAAVLFHNDHLAGKRSVVSEKVPRKTVRSGMDKSSRKTTLSETGKTHRKKTAPEIDKFSRKTPRSSLAAQPPLRLSDVDVEVHRVDSSTVQRMRNQSKERAIELPRHKLPEFPGKDLFKFAHKALLGSTFQTERLPSTGRIQEQPKDVHENRSPGLLSRIINSFSRSDRVRFMTGRGNEARSGSSEPKKSSLGTDGSGEGFASVADMRGQVAKTSHYGVNTGIHHRNKRRQSHSPQMSILGLRELRSDYNQNMNSNAKSLARQCLRRTNNKRVLLFSNIRTVQNKVIKKPTSTVLRKHLNTPMLFPLKSKQVSNIHKKRKQSPPCAFLAPRNDVIEMNSSKLHNHFTKTERDPRLTVNIPTSLASTGRTYILLMLLLALSLSILCSDCLMPPSFRSSLSAGEQMFPPQERHSREAELSLWRAVSLFGSL